MSSEEQESGNKVECAGFRIEEGVQWFSELRENSNEFVHSPLDHLSLVLHGVMLELGFSSSNSRTNPPPQPWKSPMGHSVRYFYPPEESENSVVLTVTSLGPLIKVLGIDTASKVSFSTTRLKLGDHTPAKLSHLVRVFKTEVGGPLLNSTRARLGLPVSGLLGLPPEILLKILARIDVKSLLRLARVSKQLRDVSIDQTLWKRRYLEDFGKRNFVIKEFNRTLDHQGEPDSWIEVYKQEIETRKERGKRTPDNNPVPVFHVPHPPLFPFPDPDGSIPDPMRPGVPGIIGGEYDRVPLFGGHTLRPNNFFPPRPRFDPPGPNFGGGFSGGGLL